MDCVAALPAAIWGAVVEFTGWICPLTPLENWLREQGGETSYRSDFIAQYLLPMLYPEDLTRNLQLLLGSGVVALNAAVYVWLWRRHAAWVRLPPSLPQNIPVDKYRVPK